MWLVMPWYLVKLSKVNQWSLRPHRLSCCTVSRLMRREQRKTGKSWDHRLHITKQNAVRKLHNLEITYTGIRVSGPNSWNLELV